MVRVRMSNDDFQPTIGSNETLTEVLNLLRQFPSQRSNGAESFAPTRPNLEIAKTMPTSIGISVPHHLATLRHGYFASWLHWVMELSEPKA